MKCFLKANRSLKLEFWNIKSLRNASDSVFLQSFYAFTRFLCGKIIEFWSIFASDFLVSFFGLFWILDKQSFLSFEITSSLVAQEMNLCFFRHKDLSRSNFYFLRKNYFSDWPKPWFRFGFCQNPKVSVSTETQFFWNFCSSL